MSIFRRGRTPEGPSGNGSSGEGSGQGRPRITLITKPGCHLCDDARAVVERVADELGVRWEERDITTDEALRRAYAEQIPVTLVDGRQHDFWRVDEARLRKALARAPR